MNKNINIGDKFGYLIVINEDGFHYYPSGERTRKYLCQCECGRLKSIIGKCLKTGNTKSCGCGNYRKPKSKKSIQHKYCECGKEIHIRSNYCSKCYQIGNKNSNWKGGVTPINNKIRNSKEYMEWRNKCFERDNYICQITGKKGGKLVAHHLTALSLIKDNDKLLYDINNGITIDEELHKIFHKAYGQITTEEDFNNFKKRLKGIEVKLDDKATYTGNFYIEFECNGKPSGIFRGERVELAYWAQCTSEVCYLINGHKLKEFVLEYITKCRANKTLTHKGIRLVENGGNGGITKGLLIPIDKFKGMKDLEINLL